MLFNKYQYNNQDIQKRGYSQNTIAQDEHGNTVWVKWILGVEKTDTKVKILTDKLRHLQKARHTALPDIITYGFDDEQTAFAIVYTHLQGVENFEYKVNHLDTQVILAGLGEVASCLKELHSKYKINHSDLHPANILVDSKGQFYIVDFGLADITQTLSQQQGLQIFAKHFAAPEKTKRLTGGFPYQADIYSFGKIVEWFYTEKSQDFTEEQTREVHKMLTENPSDRPQWQSVVDFLQKLAQVTTKPSVQVAFRETSYQNIIVEHLQKNIPIFDVSPTGGDNFLFNISIGSLYCDSVLWIKHENKLLFKTIKPISEIDENRRNKGKKLSIPLQYVEYQSNNNFSLTPIFQKWFDEKKQEQSLRTKQKAVRQELDFYKELLEQEIKVIEKNALRIQYTKFEINHDEITFFIKLSENENANLGFLQSHIETGNAPSSDGILYMVSANANRKQIKNPIEFTGKPYDLKTPKKDDDDSENTEAYPNIRCLKIKDCECLKPDSMPQSGYLFESTRQKEEEKNRQLDAIQKTNKNEVQNPNLIYHLFKPSDMPDSYYDYEAIPEIKQKDKQGKPFEYSYNQTKAIQNALRQSPFSVIQGPPGTGKTTVITEIVFQILAQKPAAKILITSQTNNAVDQVLENLLKNDIPLVRLSGITPPKITAIKKHTIDKKMAGWKDDTRKKAENNFKKRIADFKADLQTKQRNLADILDLILKEEDKNWKNTAEKITAIFKQDRNLTELHLLSDEKYAAIATIDSVLRTNILQFLQLHDLHKNWLATLSSLDEKSKLNEKLVDTIRVVGATCNHIAAKKYTKYNFEFDFVIMDESGKATTAEALVPITMAKNLVFVGDHRQLKPMLTSTREVEAWLREKYKQEADELESWDDYFNRPSLFEHVITQVSHDYKAQLEVCRRSSKDQIKLTSKHFYEAVGDEAIQAIDRPQADEHNFPLPINTSILFIDIGSKQKHQTDANKSSKNEESARIIPDILEYLDKYDKIQDYTVGVITGYTAQLRLLKRNIEKKRYQGKINKVFHWKNRNDRTKEEKLTISVIDRFQGLERDVVIVDLVKSGVGLNLGFLEVPNRINVALSRQKKLLIIVGDYHGIINAKTSKRLNHEKAALQNYLEALKPEGVVKAKDLKDLFK